MIFKVRFVFLFWLALLCSNCERVDHYNKLVQNVDMKPSEKRDAISSRLEKSIKESGGIAGVFSREFVKKHCQVSALRGSTGVPLPFQGSGDPFFGPHVQIMALFIFNDGEDETIWLGHFQIPFEISEEQFEFYLSDKNKKIDISNYHFWKGDPID